MRTKITNVSFLTALNALRRPGARIYRPVWYLGDEPRLHYYGVHEGVIAYFGHRREWDRTVDFHLADMEKSDWTADWPSPLPAPVLDLTLGQALDWAAANPSQARIFADCWDPDSDLYIYFPKDTSAAQHWGEGLDDDHKIGLASDWLVSSWSVHYFEKNPSY